jgi:hypothetical protein
MGRVLLSPLRQIPAATTQKVKKKRFLRTLVSATPESKNHSLRIPASRSPDNLLLITQSTGTKWVGTLLYPPFDW